jgi:hypothetical protein
MGTFLLFALCFTTFAPLLDGMTLTILAQHPELPRSAYYRVRRWGTLGFVVPSLLLLWALSEQTKDVGLALLLGSVLAMTCCISTIFAPANACQPRDEFSGRSTDRPAPRPCRDHSRCKHQ